MKVKYEYARTKMELELKQVKDHYVLSHAQYCGNPDSSLTNIFGIVKYRAKINNTELENLVSALQKRAHGKVEVAKKLYVQRSEEATSMLKLKFPNSLESVPLPRDASDEFIAVVANKINS